MMAVCAKPIKLYDPDTREYLRTVPCGKCLHCQQNRQSDWSFRILSELNDSLTSYFVTLTYDQNSLPDCYYSGRYDLQKF